MAGPVDPTAYFVSVAARHPRCFWLDGGGAREWSGRRSIIGWLDDDDVSLTYSATRREVTRHRGGRSEVVGDDIFAALQSGLAEGGGQWFGYLGYASRPDLPARPDPDLPDAVWMRAVPGRVRSFEHDLPQGSRTFRGVATPRNVRNPRSTGDSGPSPRPTAPSDEYAAAFARVQEALHAGDTYEANLTFRLTEETTRPVDPAALYLRLRELNPARYAGFLQHDVPGPADGPGARAWLLSSSPERYALIDADRMLETKPIKGTTPRGATVEEDERHRAELATHPKYRAENLMIVDLLRNDLAQVCQVGSVDVPHLMEVESYATVHQLVSTVRGRLRDDVTTIEALRALFPAGSMTGAPKLRTMQVVDEVESTPRGAYAGAFGWISPDGRADLGVVIRSLMTADPDGSYLLGTGGGITVQSDLQAEWDEASVKAQRMLDAVRGPMPEDP